MPRFIIKVARDRDAYLEWSTVVEAPVAIGSRAAFAAEHGEVRLARTDRQGTSAMYYDWLPPTQQEGGWDDAAGLIYMQRGYLRRDRFGDLYDLLDADIDAEVPDDMLVPVEDGTVCDICDCAVKP